ncbi:MAG TPA: BBE domain-containing protein [Streptosporangiaceae bacterium]|nr:BBE domain-containing protein [Streptosporangiaceae bacterium]
MRRSGLSSDIPSGSLRQTTRAPSAVMDGCYYNYPDTDLGTCDSRERALLLYFKDNLRLSSPNLVDVKTTWDRGNFFQHAQSIPPHLA